MNVGAYFKMPWLHHHSLALHASGGTSGGDYPGQGLYYVGGFQDLSILSTLENQTTQGGVELRGYPLVEQSGPNYALFNAEYRFPIVNIDRGVSTYPAFLNRVNGVVFSDLGERVRPAEHRRLQAGQQGRDLGRLHDRLCRAFHVPPRICARLVDRRPRQALRGFCRRVLSLTRRRPRLWRGRVCARARGRSRDTSGSSPTA